MENRELEELIETIGQWIIQDEARPGILNPIRMEQFHFVNTVLERAAKGTDMRVYAILYEPFHSMGSICAEGEILEFGDCKWLGRAIVFASNVEIFPTNNGRIRLTLTFHGLTTPIDRK